MYRRHILFDEREWWPLTPNFSAKERQRGHIARLDRQLNLFWNRNLHINYSLHSTLELTDGDIFGVVCT